MDSTGQASAGWYADPENPQMRRYWNGEQWTDRRAEAVPQKSGPSAWTIGRGVAIGILAVIGLLYFLGQANGMFGFGGPSDLECAIENADRAAAGLPAADC